MREFLIVLACLIIGVALRSCRTLFLRKLGALTFLVASFLTFFFLFGCWWAGLIGVVFWFLLPWVDLLTRIRSLRLPLDNRLKFRNAPREDHFPNAARMINEIEEADFEHIADSGWDWAGMQQYFRIFWHAEAKAIASVCLCEHGNVAFAFVTITSRTSSGKIIHTTNYPFSPTLKKGPNSQWAHLPCEKNRFELVYHDHVKHLARKKLTTNDLLIPDPDHVVEQIEKEMRQQIQHNEKCGLIKFTDDGRFRYSTRGLFFLWIQSMKDMIRLC